MRFRRLEMTFVDLEHLVELPRVRGIAPFFRRAELLQMQIADAGFIEPRGELALGKAGEERGRDRAAVDRERVNDEGVLGARKLADDGVGLRLLVADGEQLFHGLNRWINSMAAAGAR